MDPERYCKAVGEWSEADHLEERLNVEVYLALSQGRADIITPIAKLLRSEVNIDPVVRDALADAFEGKSRRGSKIEFRVAGQDSGSLPGWAAQHARFRRDLEISERISQVRAEGSKLHEALPVVSAEFLIGEDTCRGALRVRSRFDKWLAKNKEAYATVGVNLPPELRQAMLEGIYFRHELYREKTSTS